MPIACFQCGGSGKVHRSSMTHTQGVYSARHTKDVMDQELFLIMLPNALDVMVKAGIMTA